MSEYEHRMYARIPKICKKCYLEPATITCPRPCAAFRQLEAINKLVNMDRVTWNDNPEFHRLQIKEILESLDLEESRQ